MSVPPQSFRTAMGCFATGIAVVTVCPSGDVPVGITVNSVTSVSLEPPLVLFCIARSSRRYREVVGCREFVLNFLAENQRDISDRFAGPAVEQPWQDLAGHSTLAGTPILSGTLAHLVCSLEALQEGGDHVIVIGRVGGLDWRPVGRPLLYFRGRYAGLEAATLA